MKMMLAARYLGPDRLETEEVPLPVIGDEEALIQVEACGFCGSDISIVTGTHPRAKAPLTIGHELSGRIVEIQSSTGPFEPGDRVTTYPLISCGHCHACTHGNPHVCRQLRLFGFDVDGGMAEFVKLPVSSLMKLPEEMPGHIGALIEPLAVAVHGIGRTSLQGVQVAAVLGAGPIGLLTALVARERGVSNVIISDILPSRLDLAASLGLSVALAGKDLKSLIMELSERNGADVLFECAGSATSAREMTSLVRSRGVIVNLGVFKKPVEIDMQSINFKEIEMLGSRVYERKDFQTAIDLAMRLPLDQIVTHSFPLHDVASAFKQFQSGEVCKVLIRPMEHVS
ncbi:MULTISPECIES: zinc-binding dehydrogenase [Acidobacteriaceae]|uniref:zinc-dependent alcohol dehydrogenase n=1 Tax=Acidobacteriaceae TaxID=204434 RepID=UPI00131C6A04|nr:MULTISPECIES: alcohol dehydrogenase catalytic domain-containing protein [Acidobacteriaceae]MDW5265990.1 alcohol dehydrogenase catalytic domain-containing protein [Edaphobacter sp.]